MAKRETQSDAQGGGDGKVQTPLLGAGFGGCGWRSAPAKLSPCAAIHATARFYQCPLDTPSRSGTCGQVSQHVLQGSLPGSQPCRSLAVDLGK